MLVFDLFHSHHLIASIYKKIFESVFVPFSVRAVCFQDGVTKVQQLLSEMRGTAERHQRELETVRLQSSRDEQEVQKQAFTQRESSLCSVTQTLNSTGLKLNLKTSGVNTVE